MDEEVIVEVLADSEQVVVQLFNLFMLPQYLHILHLVVDHLVKTDDQFLLKLICKLIAREIAQTLV